MSLRDAGTAPPVGGQTGWRKVSMNMAEEDYQGLQAWARQDATTLSGLIRSALALFRLLTAEQARGSRIVIHTPKGERDQVLTPLRRGAPGLTEPVER